jgi:hypothetical protein
MWVFSKVFISEFNYIILWYPFVQAEMNHEFVEDLLVARGNISDFIGPFAQNRGNLGT